MPARSDEAWNQSASLIRHRVTIEDIPGFGQYTSCHASTVFATGTRTLVAYFGGPFEGHRRSAIYLSVKNHDAWEKPVVLASGRSCLGIERACWNPVFFEHDGRLQLYLKVGNSPQSWKGYAMDSTDSGVTWGRPLPLTSGIIGPTKNSPVVSGPWIVSGSRDERHGCAIHFEISSDTRTWRKVSPASHSGQEGCIQSALLVLGNSRLLALARSSMGCIVTAESKDDDLSWSSISPSPLPNPDSGIAALSLSPGQHFLAYNRSTIEGTPLVVATSSDGESWTDQVTLESEPGEYSYPAMALGPDGLVITYTANRSHLRLARLPHPLASVTLFDCS